MATPFAMRNRVINGAMEIDQRNAGASVTIGAGVNTYTVDRWAVYAAQASKLSAQQNAGAVTPPAGFSNYIGVTSLSSYSVTGNDLFQLYQVIEGFNCIDLGWGTASAKPATLSFWVRSSLTGTFGGSLATTSGGVWVLPFSYSIPSANTWTFVTIAIPASSSATPNLNNAGGIFVRFGLGSAGTSAGGTAGTWTNAGNYTQPSGTVSVVGTNGATFYLTGVQLEVGSVATPFERRLYTTELDLCRRYCYAWGLSGAEYVGTYSSGLYADANQLTMIPFGDGLAKLRSRAPTITTVGTQGTDWAVQSAGGVSQTGFTIASLSMCFTVNKTSHGVTNSNLQVLTSSGRIIASAEL